MFYSYSFSLILGMLSVLFCAMVLIVFLKWFSESDSWCTGLDADAVLCPESRTRLVVPLVKKNDQKLFKYKGVASLDMILTELFPSWTHMHA